VHKEFQFFRNSRLSAMVSEIKAVTIYYF
jgi:hypothetical protein